MNRDFIFRSVFITVIVGLIGAVLIISITPEMAGVVQQQTQLPPTPLPPTSFSQEDCPTFSGSMELSAFPQNPQIGETITVTTRLKNEGPLNLGLPAHSLRIESASGTDVLSLVEPRQITTGGNVPAGEENTAIFNLLVVGYGEVELFGSASFEVHPGEKCGAYWGHIGSPPLKLNVAPLED